MTYKIYHSKGTVYVIAETDLPINPDPNDDLWEKMGDSPEYKAIVDRYYAALETALSTKGIEVANAEYVGNGFDSGGPYLIYSFNNKQVQLRLNKQLCDLPEGFEVKIDTTFKCTAVGCGETDFTPGVFNCRMTVCNRSFQKTATIVPIPEETEAKELTYGQKMKGLMKRAQWLAYCKEIGWTQLG